MGYVSHRHRREETALLVVHVGERTSEEQHRPRGGVCHLIARLEKLYGGEIAAKSTPLDFGVRAFSRHDINPED